LDYLELQSKSLLNSNTISKMGIRLYNE